MKVFVINLESSIDRRHRMESLLKHTSLDWEIFPAFDGRKMTDLERDSLYDGSKALKNVGRQMSNGEIGCAISHRNIYHKMLKAGITEAVVLEDDVELERDFESVVSAISALQLKNTVLKLEDRCEKVVSSCWGRLSIDKTYSIRKPVEKKYFGAYGYYLDVEAAKRLLSVDQKITDVSDHWSFYKKFVNMRILTPHVVRICDEVNKDSDIWKFEDTSGVIKTKKKYPRGINFIVRTAKNLDLSLLKQFLP